MRRVSIGVIAGCLALLVVGSCGGGNTQPSPTPGGGGNGGGGGGQQPPVNTPPQIKSFSLSDPRVEVGKPVTVTAFVEDAETPLPNLTYTWTADNGTFSGSGPVVAWTAGQDAKTPGDFTLTLTVTEPLPSGSNPAQNTATNSVKVHVNNSPKELADLSLRFLNNFADSSVSPQTCTAEFSDSCSGKKAELSDITDNRHDFLILSSSLRNTGVDIDSSRVSATVHTFCQFTSRVITKTPQSGGCLIVPGSCPFDSVQTVQGDCFTANVYESGRWWLCKSNFAAQGAATAFERAFFGIRRLELP
jgi:hypothetical protein